MPDIFSITEPYDPETFDEPYATLRSEWTAAAHNIDHPAVCKANSLYMYVKCAFCGKIAVKNRREMRRNIKHRHIKRVFCNRTCSWSFYNRPSYPYDRIRTWMLYHKHCAMKRFRHEHGKRVVKIRLTGDKTIPPVPLYHRGEGVTEEERLKILNIFTVEEDPFDGDSYPTI